MSVEQTSSSALRWLIDSDMRVELGKVGLSGDEIETYIQHARRFKTTTTTNDWWPAMCGSIGRRL